MSDDEDKQSEEVWANEMAEENYTPEEEDSNESQPPVKKPKKKKLIPIDSYAAQNQGNTPGPELEVINDNTNDDILEQLKHPITETQEGYPQFADFMSDNQIKEPEREEEVDEEVANPNNWYLGPPEEDDENEGLEEIEVIEDEDNGANVQLLPPPEPLMAEELAQQVEEVADQLREEMQDVYQSVIDGVNDDIEEDTPQDSSVEIYDNRNVGELIRAEQSEHNQRLQEKLQNKGKEKRNGLQNSITDCLNRGLVKHNESKELENIKNMMKTQKSEVHTQKPYFGRAQTPDLLSDEELEQLFKRFIFQGQYVLSTVCPEWSAILSPVFNRQKYLWFTNEEKSGQRFLPIEVSCDTCRDLIDTEPVIRITDNVFLLEIIDKVLVHTNQLKCLRLYRFGFNRLLIVKKLRRSCGQLKHLDLTECYELRLDVIQELANSYPLMSHLILCSTDLNEEMLKCLVKKMKHLKTLNVSATYVNGRSLCGKNVLQKLKRLDIRCCPNITADSILSFLGLYSRSEVGFKQLDHLKMDAYDSRDVYRKIAQTFDSLSLLEINEIEGRVLGAGQLLNEMVLLTSLESLKIGKNMALNNLILSAILQECKKMREFSYEFNDYGENSITEENIMEIGVQWPLLERLELLNNSKIGTRFTDSLFAFKNLKYLNLTQSPRLMDHGFAAALTHLPYLNCLVLDKCLNLGKSTLDAVIIKAYRMTNQPLVVSMNRCNFRNLPYLKSKLLPKNLRITYSSIHSQKYHTFDGQRVKIGKMSEITDFLNGK